MRYLWTCCAVVAVGLCFFVVSCFQAGEDFVFNGSAVSFLKSFKETRLVFPTDDPNKNVSISIKTRPGLIRPNLSAALSFLNQNYAHTEIYQRDIYDCKQFAYRLFQDLQEANFESRYVIISLRGEDEGHALAAIETSDAGLLFVDFTPFITAEGTGQKSTRTVVQVQEGKQYTRIPIEKLNPKFSNSESDFSAYGEILKEGNEEIKRFNFRIAELEEHKKQIEKQIGDFNQKTSAPGFQRSESLAQEQATIRTAIDAINAKFDSLTFEEQRIRNSYALDWIGSAWVVKSIKMIP